MKQITVVKGGFTLSTLRALLDLEDAKRNSIPTFHMFEQGILPEDAEERVRRAQERAEIIASEELLIEILTEEN